MKGTVATGDRRHLVLLHNPGTAVPDGDGGYTQAPEPADPEEWWVKIEAASQRNLERITAATVVSTATHILSGPYHEGVTTKTIIAFGTRTFHVTSVVNPDERNIETIAIAVELVP